MYADFFHQKLLLYVSELFTKGQGLINSDQYLHLK